MSEKLKKKWGNPSMLMITGNWGPTMSFKLIPISGDAPYIEAIYNPMGKALAIIGTKKKDVFHMVERLDENGDPKSKKAKATKDEPYQKQRVTVESYSEYYITEYDEIKDFIINTTVNHETFDYVKYLDIKTMESPNFLDTTPAPVDLIKV